MADVPGEEIDDVAGGSPGRLEAGFGQVLSLFRIFVIVPVIVLLLSALASFAYGTYVFVNSVVGIVDDRHLAHGW
jgi:hypothetical protein